MTYSETPKTPADQCRCHEWIVLHHPADGWVPVPYTSKACANCAAGW